jgi:hypothetical protein
MCYLLVVCSMIVWDASLQDAKKATKISYLPSHANCIWHMQSMSHAGSVRNANDTIIATASADNYLRFWSISGISDKQAAVERDSTEPTAASAMQRVDATRRIEQLLALDVSKSIGDECAYTSAMALKWQPVALINAPTPEACATTAIRSMAISRYVAAVACVSCTF